MLGVFFGYLFSLSSLVLIGRRRIFFAAGYSSCLICFCSLFFYSSSRVVTPFFYLDTISYPLLVLSCLIVFLSILARGRGGYIFRRLRSKGYFFTILLVGTFLFPCFLVNTFFGFFIFFEARVIPLLILITRWGSQKERVQARFYFVFFTLVGSYPLLVFLFYFYKVFLSRMIGVELLRPSVVLPSLCYMRVFGGVDLFVLWWIAVLGFLIKLPVYGFHL